MSTADFRIQHEEPVSNAFLLRAYQRVTTKLMICEENFAVPRMVNPSSRSSIFCRFVESGWTPPRILRGKCQ